MTVYGSIAPLVTPFVDDLSIDETRLGALVDWHVGRGTHGISVCGTTGEPSALSLDERERVMRVAAEALDGRLPFVPGTGTNNLAETLRLTHVAESLGADAALVVVPYYTRPSQEGLLDYFSRVAAATELAVVVYNIPARTGTSIAPETLARLRERHRNVVGVKEANLDFQHASRVLYLCGRDFLLFSGIELLCYPMLAIGGAGHISATSNVLPGRLARLYELCTSGKHEEALDLHFELLPLNDALFVETNPGPLKFVLGEVGRIRPVLRPPLVLPSLENQALLRSVLASHGLVADEIAG